MLRICSRKACATITALAVLAGASVLLNKGRVDHHHHAPEVVSKQEEEITHASEAAGAVAASHEAHDAASAQAALRGIMLKGALGTVKPRPLKVERGVASSYGLGFNGRKTANGEIYNQNTYTAAHKRLPFGTQVQVKNLRNGKTVTLRINNRGPYVKGRIIDVSLKAARDLGMLKAGVVPVEVTVLAGDSRSLQASQ
ncbi:MAG TPA: septal ring lytic transglycosylase RlpA family protein [Verrucomicrobium sp.]|nr:septal ring lytic transglycosylase RlpA family protein [Verrucomicrobium sp.]